MVSPVTEEDDVLGCSFLLNLLDALRGVEVIEEELKQREIYHEIFSIMNIGMSYSSIQNLHKGCSTPSQRRGLLFQKFREKYASLDSDEVEHLDEVQSTFWREWKEKLEDQKRLADQARALEETVPGVDTSRFFEVAKKHILREAVELATMYGLQRAELWENDDIVTEIAEYREEIINCANDVIEMISTVVFPKIDGHNKCRLSFVYSILSVCHLHRSKTDDPSLSLNHTMHKRIEPFRFCKVLEQECQNVSSIKELNFKYIAGLEMLNYDSFNGEILSNVKDSTVECLAEMVRALLGLAFDANEKGLISWQDVYKHYVLTLLSSLESRTGENPQSRTLEELQVLLGNVEQNYDLCAKYIRALPEQDISCIIRRYQKLCISCISSEILTDDSALKSCLVMVLDFWVKLAEDFQASECCAACEKPDFFNEMGMSRFVNTFRKLVMEDEISGTEAWCTIVNYVNQDKRGVVSVLPSFVKAMIFSGCRFDLIASLYFKVCIPSSSANEGKLKHLLALYTSLTEDVLSCIVYDSAERRNLHGLLSSLSKMEGSHREECRVIRSEVWTKLTEFSDKMQLENSIKVYALELMQSISGQKYNIPHELISEVKPWEDWDESLQSTSVQELTCPAASLVV
ncbi:hypothetical protein HPP92_002518 [Vanilla planifolia]|uniref:Uncharacterized protein n=1 Tax=Vanilla planifolia TaxID=51239 RepID=A0A835S1Y3_VANPL|nr:hypothetical protein HPP92_002518 [Vanilla planifolia]